MDEGPERPRQMQKLMDRQAAVQDKIDALDAWELDTKLSIAMDAFVVLQTTKRL